MQDKNYVVYIHKNKADGKRYVGTTRQNPERRWQRGRGYAGTLFGNEIERQGWDAFGHEIAARGLSVSEAYKLEIELIDRYKTTDPAYGYNVSAGGKTGDNLIPMYGIDHPNHQRVRMLDPNTGEVLRIFDAQAEAARELDISRKGITKACMGVGCATYKGFLWEYADKDYKKPGNPGVGNYAHTKIQKAVKVVLEDGQALLFESVKAACEDLITPKNSAWRYLKQGYPDREGRRWCYA